MPSLLEMVPVPASGLTEGGGPRPPFFRPREGLVWGSGSSAPPHASGAGVHLSLARDNELALSASTSGPREGVSEGEDVCCVCFCSFSSGRCTFTGCRHRFHSACLHKWLTTPEAPRNCPMCRASLGRANRLPAQSSQRPSGWFGVLPDSDGDVDAPPRMVGRADVPSWRRPVALRPPAPSLALHSLPLGVALRRLVQGLVPDAPLADVEAITSALLALRGHEWNQLPPLPEDAGPESLSGRIYTFARDYVLRSTPFGRGLRRTLPAYLGRDSSVSGDSSSDSEMPQAGAPPVPRSNGSARPAKIFRLAGSPGDGPGRQL